MLIAGVDEVGRGPWAGPVITAAVILQGDASDIDLRDSKKMSATARATADTAIRERMIYAFGAASRREIDALNIRQATHLAMARAVWRLPTRPHHIDIDGRDVPDALVDYDCASVIKGDATHPHIAAASIIAKELRDRLMRALDVRYPDYGWASNAGYGTKAHQAGLASAGVTPHHRRSFRPIAEAMG